MKPWAGGGSATSHASSPPPPPPSTFGEVSPYNLVLADTRRSKLFHPHRRSSINSPCTAKTFAKSFASFALVPSAEPHPLTSNVMLVNKDGDLDLYAVHDTPVHTPWSSRGDLALGVGCSYTILPGITDTTPPREPWDLLAARPSRPGSRAYSLERREYAEDGSFSRRYSPTYSMASAPTFGRGDEDGFPALSPAPATPAGGTSPGRRRDLALIPESKLIVKELPFEHTAVGNYQPPKRSKSHGRAHGHDENAQTHAPPTTPKTVTLALDDGESRTKHPKKSAAVKALQHVVEFDISMLMRRRAVLAYGLTDVSSFVDSLRPWANHLLYSPSTTLSSRATSPLTIWSYLSYGYGSIVSRLILSLYLPRDLPQTSLSDAQRLMSSPSPVIEGYNFAYQGLSGIWEGFKPIHPSPRSGQPTPRMPARSALFDAASPLLAPLNLEVPHHRSSSKHTGRKRSQVPASTLPEHFLIAIDELNARCGSMESGAGWKPSVATARLSQRRFALQLCGWSLAQDTLARAIRRWVADASGLLVGCVLTLVQMGEGE